MYLLWIHYIVSLCIYKVQKSDCILSSKEKCVKRQIVKIVNLTVWK